MPFVCPSSDAPSGPFRCLCTDVDKPHLPIFSFQAGVSICHGGKKTCVRSNVVWGNLRCGILLCHSANILITRNSIHHNGRVGAVILETGGLLEGNRLWAHAEAGVQIIGGSKDLSIASNCINDGERVGILVEDGSEGRVQGNALWRNEGGVDLPTATNVSVTGNLFSMNGVGICFDSPGQAPRAGVFGPGNVFSRSLGADCVERAADGIGRVISPAPSDTASCAHCSAAIAAGKSRCGGCSKFGPAFAPCYCGEACQKAHWPAHRAECGRAEERARMREAAFEAAADALLAFKPRREDGAGTRACPGPV